jgi:UDP-GlcNAc:undecaprenyl-phosphate GlcNAc-1-phosphate transferase
MPFIAALVLGLVLTPIALRVALLVGLVDHPSSSLKIHGTAVPVLGGLAVLLSTFGAVIGSGSLSWGVAAAVTLCFLVGLVDDIKPLPSWFRLAAQTMAGVVLVAAGIRMTPLGIIGIFGVIALVVSCVNAVNLLDGQDGLAAGVSCLAAGALAALAALAGDWRTSSTGLAMAGSLIGFLFWNRPPARIFLGNGGAFGIGALLATLAAGVVEVDGWRGLAAAGVALALLAFEVVFTVARRLRAGGSLVEGDRFHSYDLLANSAGRPRVTYFFWLLGAAAAAVAIGVAYISPTEAVLTATAVSAVAAAGGARLWMRYSPR